MGRRWRGLTVIVLVLLVAAGVPHLRLRVVAGGPIAVAVPGQPAVGDCLTAPLSADQLDPPVPIGGADTYPSLSQTPCQGPRFGEVVDVISSPARPITPFVDHGSGVVVTDPNRDQCELAAAAYSGQSGTSTFFTHWAPPSGLSVALSAPSVREQAAGQKWLACIAYASALDLGTAQLEGSLRNAWSTGVDRDQVGQCAYDPDLVNFNLEQMQPSCRLPHTIEYFGRATTLAGPGTDTADLARTCSQLVRQLTGLADATAGGQLKSEVEFNLNDSPVDPKSITVTAAGVQIEETCEARTSAGRRLTGSLLRIGNDPIPWE